MAGRRQKGPLARVAQRQEGFDIERCVVVRYTNMI
jgi:hypothetical protein